MRVVCAGVVGLILLYLCLPSPLISQVASPAPSCITPSGLRTELRLVLDDSRYGGVAFDERIAQQTAKLNELIDRYPSAAEPQRQLVELALRVDTRQLASVQERFRREAAANPTDPLALFAYGYSLLATNAVAARETLTNRCKSCSK